MAAPAETPTKPTSLIYHMKIIKRSKSKVSKTIAPKAAVKKSAAISKPVKATAKPARKTVPAQSASPITSDQIARRAYLIWEQQGRPAGKEREHWLLAEQELKSSQSFAE